ncbi:RNA-directed DNA polymerase, eukaryota [Tanacetum coccineum]|uniref:RNA-directed DNA polymerase, eukaryota n=1 Tax=Tanacetum coccineum TaxID=301880 RepID=A0ABQ5GFD8_9ASTR
MIYSGSVTKLLFALLNSPSIQLESYLTNQQAPFRKPRLKWTKVLASKKYGGLGVSSFYALNRALLFRWVWRFLSHDNSLWFRFISAMHGSSFQIRSSFHCSNWLSINREVSALKLQGIYFLSHCKRRVGSGMQTRFWEDLWLGEVPFNELFPRLYALENNKECSVAVKMQGEIDSSFRRHVRGGVETQQLENIQDLVRSKVLSNVDDRWAWDLNGGGDFCVKDARDLVDEVLLPKENVATRWIKTIPIKVNVFAWKLHLDRLPTRSNLLKRGIQVQSSLCPICNVLQEDTSHLFFSCDVALAISRLICRWWNVSWSPVDSYSGWLEWFNSIRLGSKLKGILEGVFYVSWWCLWNFRNQLLFASKKPRKETLFDDVVSRSFIWSNSRCYMTSTDSISHRLGGLYCLYCIHETQPFNPPFRIYLSPWQLKRLKELVIDAKKENVGINARVQHANKRLFADTDIERYIHMDMGKEVDLELLKKMSIDYAMAKELAIKGLYFVADIIIHTEVRGAEKVIDTQDINHIAENQTLIGDVVGKTIADCNIHKETFYQKTGLNKRQVLKNRSQVNNENTDAVELNEKSEEQDDAYVENDDHFSDELYGMEVELCPAKPVLKGVRCSCSCKKLTVKCSILFAKVSGNKM